MFLISTARNKVDSFPTSNITANMSIEASRDAAPKITIVRDLQDRQIAYVDSNVGYAAAVERISPSYQ